MTVLVCDPNVEADCLRAFVTAAEYIFSALDNGAITPREFEARIVELCNARRGLV